MARYSGLPPLLLSPRRFAGPVRAQVGEPNGEFEGAVLFEVMMGDPRSWGEEPEAFDAALAARGAEALPDPPLEFPAWLADLRTHWAGSPPGTGE